MMERNGPVTDRKNTTVLLDEKAIERSIMRITHQILSAFSPENGNGNGNNHNPQVLPEEN